jgi:hypothetical protein
VTDRPTRELLNQLFPRHSRRRLQSPVRTVPKLRLPTSDDQSATTTRPTRIKSINAQSVTADKPKGEATTPEAAREKAQSETPEWAQEAHFRALNWPRGQHTLRCARRRCL